MRGRLFQQLAAGSALIALAGCVQATRHSNTMVFGTNTTFGIKAGTTAGEAPEVVVGYDRQEAVIMPLLANTSEADGDKNRLKPCDPTAQPMRVDGGKYAVHPCSFVAYNGAVQDSYSVLASFGANFSGTSNGAPEAKGGLAQYFATGLAAQILALKGGAALVATGQAADQSAQTSDTTSLTALLTGEADYEAAQRVATDAQQFTAALSTKIRSTAASELIAKLTLFESRAGVNAGADKSCAALSPAQCADFISQRDLYALFYPGKSAGLQKALNDWDIPAN